MPRDAETAIRVGRVAWLEALCSTRGPRKPTTRHVLMVLAKHMDDDGAGCRLGVRRIMEQTGLSSRGVIDQLDEAKHSWWVVWEEVGKGGRAGRVYSATVPCLRPDQLEHS